MAHDIVIRFSSFDNRVLDSSIYQVVSSVKKIGGTVVGPIPLPTKIEKFSFNRSPHVNKSSMEQFEIRNHKRLLIIPKVSAAITDTLAKLELPSSVDVKVIVSGGDINAA